ncbi:MAG: cell division topological specificity factor MinE, partial [Candidatus Gastranaerophilales bacterium]|nr:cell division topological specificity factor MinE [Candidatus Gastranaerophilales bacterium]MCM1073646.1 cell division topological specificity factor MinE [Bacteroides sp.]
DFYNTVAKFFRPQEEQLENDPSKSVATNRLKLVLMQDRTNLTPKVLEQMRGEMIELLSKYLEMDKDMLELNFEQEGDQVALMLSIPVIRAKDEDEIEAAMNSDEEEIEEEDETAEETEYSEEDEEKPKKRRSKKVTPPEGVNEGGNDNPQEEHHEEVFENVEG